MSIVFKYCDNCWEKNELIRKSCKICGDSFYETDLRRDSENMSKLFQDKEVQFRNGFFGLLFAELTLNLNFQKHTDYSLNCLNIVENLIKEINHNNSTKMNDLDKHESLERNFDINLVNKNFKTDLKDGNEYAKIKQTLINQNDANVNLLKLYPFIYYFREIDPDKIYSSNTWINFLYKKAKFNKNTYQIVYEIIKDIIDLCIIYKNKKNRFVEQIDSIKDLLKKAIDKLNYKLIGYKDTDFYGTYLAEYISSKNYEIKTNQLKVLLEKSVEIEKSDLSKSNGIVNTIESVVYSIVNNDNFIDSIKDAIILENELKITTALTGIIAGLFYKFNEKSDYYIPIINKKESYSFKEEITFKELVHDFESLETYFDNYENVILKEQINSMTKFLPFFKNAKEKDCYNKEISYYPLYPDEMMNFSFSIKKSGLEDYRVHSKMNELMEKYDIKEHANYFYNYYDTSKVFTKSIDVINFILLRETTFSELKIFLYKYIRNEHMVEGSWARCIKDKLFYQILLRFEEYNNFIVLKNLKIPKIKSI